MTFAYIYRNCQNSCIYLLKLLPIYAHILVYYWCIIPPSSYSEKAPGRSAINPPVLFTATTRNSYMACYKEHISSAEIGNCFLWY